MWLLELSRSSGAGAYVVARESSQGDRLLPSRLLLPDLPETVERLPRLLCDRLDQRIRVSTEMGQHNDCTQDVNFPLVPSVLPRVERMSVTEFRTWLDSPLRFVLKKLSLGRTFAPWRPERCNWVWQPDSWCWNAGVAKKLPMDQRRTPAASTPE